MSTFASDIQMNTQRFLLCLDFDNTMTAKCITKEIAENPNEKNLLSEPFCGNNLHTLQSAFEKFRQNGNKIIIVSYNSKITIRVILEQYNIHDMFDAIVTPEDFYSNYCESMIPVIMHELRGKNKMIEFYDKDIKKSNVLLVDDNCINCEYATKDGYNIFHIVQTPMSLSDAKELMEMMLEKTFDKSHTSCKINGKNLQNTPIDLSNENAMVRKLFNIVNPETGNAYHHFTIDRYIWVCNWLGKCINCHDNCYVFEQLCSLWRLATFNPFMDLISAETYIRNNKREHVVRLSTTKPGHISITFIHSNSKLPASSRICISEEKRTTFMWSKNSSISLMRTSNILEMLAQWKIDNGLYNLSHNVLLPRTEQTYYGCHESQQLHSKMFVDDLVRDCRNLDDPISRYDISDISPRKMVFIHLEDPIFHNDVQYIKPLCMERDGLENYLLKQIGSTDIQLVEYKQVLCGTENVKKWVPREHSDTYIKIPFDFNVCININDARAFFDESRQHIYMRTLRFSDNSIRYLKLGCKFGNVRGNMSEFYIGIIK